MKFRTSTIVRFGQVDGAGIVFYPRYFEMFNTAVEEWFAGPLGCDFATLHDRRRLGVPTLKIDTHFHRPSRLGDRLDITIELVKIGTTSVTLRYLVSQGEELRVEATGVLVCMNLDSGKSTPWPVDLQSGMTAVA